MSIINDILNLSLIISQSAISAVAATEQAVPGPSAAPSAPLAPAPRSSAAAAAAATLAESTASASAAGLILDKVWKDY